MNREKKLLLFLRKSVIIIGLGVIEMDVVVYTIIKTAGKAGGLLLPCKGILLAGLKALE